MDLFLVHRIWGIMMDHSICGYLHRRSREELEEIIALYSSLQESEYNKMILDIAIRCLEERIVQEPI